ncbi:MAG: ornithine carbamoyltransferase [Coriobacteriia bacterium]|nr:ornithine carbamoyltransferase [Coriobacteriia bacterium]
MSDDTLRGRDLLTLADLTPAELRLVLDRAAADKARWTRGEREAPLNGKAAALVFLKPSVRTRVSFEVACGRLGLQPVVLGPGDAFSRSETVHDTVKVLERYVDAIVLRTSAHGHLEEVAEHSSVPVVNALTDDHHPCQVLADLLTIEERKGRLAGLRFAYVGDGNNMANSYLLGGALTGLDVTIAGPEGFEPAEDVLARARELASANRTGARLRVVREPAEAVAGADVVATDTWASMGREDERETRLAAFAAYTCDAALMERAAEDALFMHCLPAHRGEEVTDEVIDSPRSVVFDEAENRLHAQKALLSLLLG